jgi:hypothetical protein
MAIVNGCKFGIPSRGGAPRQCAKTVVASVVVSAAQGQRHTLEVCQEHWQHFDDVRQGTEYTEDQLGRPAPVRVSLVSL